MSRLRQLHTDGEKSTLYVQAWTTHVDTILLKKINIYFKYYLMETNCVSVCMAKNGLEIFITFAQ